ncbi:MAG: DPP IV N-terminal domain-containing protein [bacterium]|nr:DPP IV N-terminal domain-containing protein [bacterium]
MYFRNLLIFILFNILLFQNTFGQREVVLQGRAQGGSIPILFYQGAVAHDSSRLDLSDEASLWGNRLIHALKLSGRIKVTDAQPDSIIPGQLIPNVKLEVKKASVGGAVTVSLYAEKTIKPYWLESFKLKVTDRDPVLQAGSMICMQLTGEPSFINSRIYYAATVRSGVREIFSSDITGQFRTQLTNDNTIILSPTVSPDGQWLCYTSFRNGNADVWIRPIQGGTAKPLCATPSLDSSPSFSPDSKYVAFASSDEGNTEIYIIDIHSTNKTRLTFSGSIDTAPSWSPTGERIVFMSDRSGSPQIYTMSRDGTDVRRITYEGEYNDSPHWSPTGDRIVYVRREGGVFQLYLTDPIGLNHKRLLYYSSDQKDPCFTPGGYRISFVVGNWQGKTGIALLTPDTSEVDLLLGDVVAQRPVWGPPN